MTVTLVLLIALYAVWRFANVYGRRRTSEHQAMRGARGWLAGGSVIAARCSRCGRYLRPEEIEWLGRWPMRQAACAGGCSAGAGDGGADVA